MISANHQTHSASRKPTAGFRSSSIIILLIMLECVHSTLYKEMIYDSVLMETFGTDLCITGTLKMAPTVPVVVQSPHVQDNQITSSEHELGKLHDEGLSMDNGIAKEKTPMCLVNELARYNKIEHQYRLTSEEGPPHKKRFTVTLKLGSEEYTAEGPSIKKAQHSAAGKALKETNYKHPPPKSLRNSRPGKGNITPTVELNALAMKRGEPTVYTVIELPPMPQYNYNYHHRGMYTQPFNEQYGYSYAPNARPKFSYSRGTFNNLRRTTQRYQGGGLSKGYKVNVAVGEREFTGGGATAQAARHDAAAKALSVLRDLPLDTPPHHHHLTCDGVDADSSSELKSPISLVHEIALKRNLSVSFEVVSEKGPPHMRTFVTKCAVGDKFESSGEGNGKKVSKKRAAEKMLELLRTLPPMTTVTTGSNCRIKRKPTQPKKKPRNLIKETNIIHNPQQEQKYDSESTEDMNPISRLIQIQQAKREKEPAYTLKEEKGTSRRREFHIEVSVGEQRFIGTGPNKKLAKRNAAEGMLQLLGYSSPVLNSQGHLKYSTLAKSGQQDAVGGVSGRQLVPGLLLMTDNKGSANPAVSKSASTTMKVTADVAKEYLNSHAAASQGDADTMNERTIRPSEQLHYLSQVLNFKVQYSDFPKGNHNEFLSLVTLSTDPPQVCHGSGPNTEISKDQAALNALRSLSEMGLDSISSSKKPEPPTMNAAINSTMNSTAPGPNTEIYLGLGNSISKDDTFLNGK